MDILQRETEQGVEILKRGGVIAFPTDTVYGLGADAFNAAAVERIYRIKGRPRHRQLPLLIAGVEQLAILTHALPEVARFFAGRFWPGGLTLVLPKGASLPSHLAQGTGIAVRVPNHPLCLALIEGLGNPIVGTSANISGRPPALSAGEVKQQLTGKIDFVIDGGRCPGKQESTVVDVTHQTPVILREGVIPSCEIDRACKEYMELNSEAHCHRL